MIVEGKTIPFKLPAKIGAVKKVLMAQVKRPQPGTKDRIAAQSERTAWKLIHEWVQIQITMIKLDQAEFIELFLPHVYDFKNDKSYYETLKESGFKQLISGD